MGINSQRVYFDSCIAIYLVEEHPTFAPMVEARLAKEASVANVIIQVSDLTEMECLVMPLRKRNQPLLDKYRQWFEEVEVLPVERKIFSPSRATTRRFRRLEDSGCDSSGNGSALWLR